MADRIFTGKIILFGEYTVLSGYRALALPYGQVFGQWQLGQAIDDRLLKWLAFLKDQQNKAQAAWLTEAALNQFEKDIQQGLQFQSNIPTGFGVGSSGALVAAWYARFIAQSPALPLAELQTRLSTLEGHFHGKSSGLDPLVSLLGKAIMVQGNSAQLVSELPLTFPKQLALVDTELPRSTAPIVQVFHEKCKDKVFREEVLPNLGRAQELAIDAYILGDWQNVGLQFRLISELQFAHFSEMIPAGLRSAWKQGWSEGLYHKLCGAGGGGYMLKWSDALKSS